MTMTHTHTHTYASMHACTILRMGHVQTEKQISSIVVGVFGNGQIYVYTEPNNYDDYDDDGDGNIQDIGNGISFTNRNEMKSMIKIMVVLFMKEIVRLDGAKENKIANFFFLVRFTFSFLLNNILVCAAMYGYEGERHWAKTKIESNQNH